MSTSEGENIWTCTQCTLDNPSNNDICQACGHQRPGNNTSWTCRTCSLKNPERNTRCSACRSARTQAIESSASSPLNGVHNLLKRVVASVVREEKPSWSCAKCTLQNPSSRTSCAACGSRKEVIVIPDDEELDSSGPERQSHGRLYPDLKIEIPKIDLDTDIAQQSPELVVKCPKCQTLLLDNAGLNCSVCGAKCQDEGFKPRPFPSSSIASTPESLPPSIPGKWNCPNCTFTNENSRDKCKICNIEKDTGSAGVETADSIVPRGMHPSSINEPSTSGMGATSGGYTFVTCTYSLDLSLTCLPIVMTGK